MPASNDHARLFTVHPTQDFLMNSPWLGGSIFVLTAVLMALTCYAVVRSLLTAHIADDSELLSARLIARLGTLHALILALMFAQEIADYRSIYTLVSKEASAISDVYRALQDYDAQQPGPGAALRTLIMDYLTDLMRIERTALAEDRPSYRSWLEHQRINRQLLNLHATNDRQRDLRAQMLADWDKVSEFHLRLRTTAHNEVPHFLWVVMVTGFLVVVFPCYVYKPKLANLATLSVFAGFNGIVMYLIFSISNPFTGPAAIDAFILGDLMAFLNDTAR